MSGAAIYLDNGDTITVDTTDRGELVEVQLRDDSGYGASIVCESRTAAERLRDALAEALQ